MWPWGKVILVVVLGCAVVFGQYVHKGYDPNDPYKTRMIIPRLEREKLGLAEKDWNGVVHPQVYRAMERLNGIVKKYENVNSVEAIDVLGAMRFKRTVYVQVLLKSEGEIKGGNRKGERDKVKTRQRVLSDLTAAEFHVQQVFENPAGLVGFVSREGLNKLAGHPDVAGVCLDNKPLSEPVPVLYKDQVPGGKQDEFAGESGFKAGRVSWEVYWGLARNDRLFVLVALREDARLASNLAKSKDEKRPKLEEEKRTARLLCDQVLRELTADEFWLSSKFETKPVFGGYINRRGLEKLW